MIPRGTTSLIRHIFILDSTSTVGAGKTGLAYDTASLVASYIYPGGTRTAITLETIATLGTYAAPTSNAHMRFKEVDAANMPGWYEIHLHNDWASVANGRTKIALCLKGATGMAPVNASIDLLGFDVQDADPSVDVTKIGGVAQSDQYVKVSSGTGTGQISLSSGQVTVYDVSNTGLASIWSYATRTLSSFGTLVADIWSYSTRVLTAISDSSGITTLLARLTAIRAGNLDYLDAAVSSRSTYAGGAVASVTGSVGSVLEVATGAITDTSFDPSALDAIRDGLATEAKQDLAKAILDKVNTMLAASGSNFTFTVDALKNAPSGGSSPTVQDIVDGVWDEALSGHGTAGSAGEALATAGSGGIPSDVLDQIDAIEAIVTALQASAVLVQSNTIGTGGTVRMFYGLDYKQVDGRAVSWINEAGSWPNLTGATISVLDFDTRADLGGTGTVVTATGANQTVRWEVAKTVFTAAMLSKKYILKATLSNGDEIDLTEGSLLIR